jgi:hypothetical protein
MSFGVARAICRHVAIGDQFVVELLHGALSTQLAYVLAGS